MRHLPFINLLLAGLMLLGGMTALCGEDTTAPAVAPPVAASAETVAPAPAATEVAAPAAATASVDTGDTAWMLTATALVLLMTIPGLFLFYGGLVRRKNVLSVLMQCFAITCMVTILWTAYGYSMAFDTGGMVKGEFTFNSLVGGLSKAFASGINLESMVLTIPESVFFVFQLTFAIITPALIVGAFAERMKFSAMLIFTAGWLTLVYLPICHMVWSGDGALMWDWGVLDFAGGTVVHINAGVAGLLAAIILGKRQGYLQTPMKPHNMTMSVTGAALLWVGWFGFNAGSAVGAGQSAGMAMLVTQVATAAAGFTWMLCEWIKHGKPSALGIISGAVAGLVAITPASGTCGPVGALVIGAVSALACFVMVVILKRKLGYDDALDAFGVHGVGGLVGALLTGIFAAASMGGMKADADLVGGGIAGQVMAQIKGAGFTIIWCGVITVILLYVIKAVIGLRAKPEDEVTGLDLSEHGEEGYDPA